MAGDDEYPDEVEERLINEEYKIWKKNTPFLYGAAGAGGGLQQRATASGRCSTKWRTAAGAHSSRGAQQQQAARRPMLTLLHPLSPPTPSDLVITHALEWPSHCSQNAAVH